MDRISGDQRRRPSFAWGLVTFLVLGGVGCGEQSGQEDVEQSAQTLWSDNRGIIRFQDDSLSLTINCRTQGCVIEKASKRRSDGQWIQLLVGTGYWWGASPRGVPDGACGFAATNTYGNPHVNYNIEASGWGIRINWSQGISEYCRDVPVGMRAWGSYGLPWNTSLIQVWHAFRVEDPGMLQRHYGTKYLDSFAANLDMTGDFTDLTWPSDTNRGAPGQNGFLDQTFTVLGGDWAQPNVSWANNGCQGQDRYHPGYGVVTRDLRDIRCHPRFNGQDAGLAVQVPATTGRGRDKRPYLIMHSPSSNLSVARVLTGHSERRKTMQAFTNALFTSGNSVMSSTISWDWGDGNLEAWWPSGFHAPELGPGWFVDTNEELWIGEGREDGIRGWIRGAQPIE